MPLEAAYGLSPTMRGFVQAVRAFTRDYAQLNQLIRGDESSDRMIAWAVFDFISDFNSTGPLLTNVDLDYILGRGWGSFAVRGTVSSLLTSLQLLYTRNHIPFSDGGISVSLNDKAGVLMQIQSVIQSGYEQRKKEIKIAMNIEQLLTPDSTGLFSDYALLSGSYGF